MVGCGVGKSARRGGVEGECGYGYAYGCRFGNCRVGCCCQGITLSWCLSYRGRGVWGGIR
jgi:hypothetical protein